jgi:hypothetical protein
MEFNVGIALPINFFKDLIESNIYSKSLKVAIYLTKLLKDFIENNSYFLDKCQDDEHVHFKQKILVHEINLDEYFFTK